MNDWYCELGHAHRQDLLDEASRERLANAATQRPEGSREASARPRLARIPIPGLRPLKLLIAQRSLSASSLERTLP
jgi:hypothetical protein